MKIVIIYDQIQSDLGTEDSTMVPLVDKRKPIGPAIMMEPFLKQADDHVTACLCYSNGIFLADSEEVSRKLCAMINKLQSNVTMYGPTFNSADYTGMYAKVVCDTNAITKTKAFAATSAGDEDTIAAYKDKVVIMKTPKEGNMGLDDVLRNMYVSVKVLADDSDTAELEHKLYSKQRRIYRMWGMITTWRMVVEGITKSAQMLKSGGDAGGAIESAIREVEDFPYYKSTGYGGLPNEETEVETDAALMDGNTLDIGAVAAIRGFVNPVSIARRLSREKVNNLLMAEGAEKFAHKGGFGRKDVLADQAKAHYRKRIEEMPAQAAIQTASQKLKPYSGRDIVGIVCLGMTGKMTAVTSTSGLFMKRKGRVGDSSTSGSGLYANSKKGAVSATGLGEDLMKDCISYEIVRLVGEDMHPQEACEIAVSYLDVELRERRDEAGDLSLIAMNPRDEWGMIASIESFPSAVVTESQESAVYLVTRQENSRYTCEQVSGEWTENYMKTRMVPIEE